jgi:radical SAM protein with 4Fe4S-binding SPASM domain
MELFEKLLEDIKAFPQRLKAVRLYFLGEPLLNPRFTDMFRLLCRSDCCERIEVTTNGSLLTEDTAKAVLEASRCFAGEIYFRFSIYAVGQEHFFRVTGNPMDERRIAGNIAAFRALRDGGSYPNVFLYAKKLKTLDEEDEAFLAAYSPLVDEAALEEPMNWSGDGGEEDFLLKKEYSDEALARLRKKIEYPKVCSYLFTTMAVQSDGAVVACCVDWSRKTEYGNAKKQSLQEIWNGEKLRQLRMLHLEGRRGENDACRNCRRMPLDVRDRLEDHAEEIMLRLGK